MKHELKRTARLALKATAAMADPMFGPIAGPRILIYHQVGVRLDREMEVSTGTFIEQLDWLQANHEIVDLEAAVNRRGEADAAQLFVLTFDDGFEDIYHNAFPVMKERSIPLTLYLTTNPIETGEPIDSRYPAAKPLTWDQVNEMIASGLVTVGAHTHTHRDLRKAHPRHIADELDRSDELIERHTGFVPRHFAYPWGWWSQAADPIVRSRYETATVGSTSSITTRSDLLTLGRFPVQSSDGVTWFVRRMARGLRLENSVRRRRASYSGP